MSSEIVVKSSVAYINERMLFFSLHKSFLANEKILQAE